MQFGSEVFQFDVSSAYLNAELEEDVYVERLPDFEVQRKSSNFDCKLLKGLYGLKQAGCCWNRTLDHFLTNFGLVRSFVDNCCYSEANSAGNRLFVCVWVDDIMYFSTCSILGETFEDSFSKRTKIEEGQRSHEIVLSVSQSGSLRMKFFCLKKLTFWNYWLVLT